MGQLTEIKIEHGDRDKYLVVGSRVPVLLKFKLYGETFHVHQFVDDGGTVRMGGWQFSYDGTPIAYIPSAAPLPAVQQFVHYADMMGEGRMLDKLVSVVTENRRRIGAGAPE